MLWFSNVKHWTELSPDDLFYVHQSHGNLTNVSWNIWSGPNDTTMVAKANTTCVIADALIGSMTAASPQSRLQHDADPESTLIGRW